MGSTAPGLESAASEGLDGARVNSSPRPGPRGERLEAIDALRGVAILAVLACHLVVVTPWGRNALAGPGLEGTAGLAKALENGLLGVNLFFVLSGFVLFRPFADGSRPLRSGADVRGFLGRRLARLGPMFLLAVLVPLAMRFPYAELLDLLACLAWMFSGLFVFSPEHHVPRFNTPLWSLGSELWFSLLFPFVVMARRRWGWRAVLPAVAVGSLLARFWAPAPIGAWLPAAQEAAPGIASLKLFAALVLGRLDDFVLGAFLADLHARGALDRAVPFRWPLLGGAVSAFAVTVPWRHGEWSGWNGASPFLNTWVQLGVAAAVVALIVWPRGFVRRVLWAAPLRFAGVICFSLYVWHAPVMNAFLVRTVSWDRLGMWAVLTFGLSLTTAIWVERVLPRGGEGKRSTLNVQ
jgi:peptidoglycan/LPS O-acetylase OafA/YrhL